MAVIQISRIQQRRGREGTTGIPQLASGEIGWAIDTQKLYIGNGAVSEGAPAVGNTQILTANDDIFDFTDSYSFKKTSSIWGTSAPYERSLQDKLDDFVSVADFGVTGDGTNVTTKLIQAIDALFLNGLTDRALRYKLYFPAGNYAIESTIPIPPFVQLIGAGVENTKITMTKANTPMFQTVSSNYTGNGVIPVDSPEPYNAINPQQCRFIGISDMHLEHQGETGRILFLNNCAFGEFKNLKMTGKWTVSAVGNQKAIEMNADSDTVTCIGNMFDNIMIDSFEYHVYSDHDIRDNTWKDCEFVYGDVAMAFGEAMSLGTPGSNYGPRFSTISNCKFDQIKREGIKIVHGEYNVSRDNKFFEVGTNLGDTTDGTVSPVIALSSNTNVSETDFFDRTGKLLPNNPDGGFFFIDSVYYPEVDGQTKVVGKFTNQFEIGEQSTPKEMLKVPLIENGVIEIEYLYTETGQGIQREGTLSIVNNSSLATPQLSDVYTHTGPALYNTAFTWAASVVDNNSDGTDDTIHITLKNTIPVANDNFVYTVNYRS